MSSLSAFGNNIHTDSHDHPNESSKEVSTLTVTTGASIAGALTSNGLTALKETTITSQNGGIPLQVNGISGQTTAQFKSAVGETGYVVKVVDSTGSLKGGVLADGTLKTDVWQSLDSGILVTQSGGQLKIKEGGADILTADLGSVHIQGDLTVSGSYPGSSGGTTFSGFSADANLNMNNRDITAANSLNVDSLSRNANTAIDGIIFQDKLNLGGNDLKNVKDVHRQHTSLHKVVNSLYNLQDSSPAKVIKHSNGDFCDVTKVSTVVSGSGEKSVFETYYSMTDGTSYHAGTGDETAHSSTNAVNAGSYNSFGFGKKSTTGQYGGFDCLEFYTGGEYDGSHRARIYPQYNISNRFSSSGTEKADNNYVMEFKPDDGCFDYILRNSDAGSKLMRFYDGRGVVSGKGTLMAEMGTEGLHNGHSFTLFHYCKNHTDHLNLTDGEINSNLLGKIFEATDNCSVLEDGVEISSYSSISANVYDNALSSCSLNTTLQNAAWLGILTEIIDKDQTSETWTANDGHHKEHFKKPQAHTMYKLAAKGDAMAWLILEVGLGEAVNKGDLLKCSDVEESVVTSTSSYDFNGAMLSGTAMVFRTSTDPLNPVGVDVYQHGSSGYFYTVHTDGTPANRYLNGGLNRTRQSFDFSTGHLTMTDGVVFVFSSWSTVGTQNFGGFLERQGNASLMNYTVCRYMGPTLTEGNAGQEGVFTNSSFSAGASNYKKFKVPVNFL